MSGRSQGGEPDTNKASSKNNRPGFTAFIDGACRGNPGPGAAAVVLYADDVVVSEKAVRLGNTTNNQAEYSALIMALEEALAFGCRGLTVKTDSQLIARQVGGRYRVRNRKLVPLREKARGLISEFERFEVVEIPREDNEEADRLANSVLKKKASKPAAS